MSDLGWIIAAVEAVVIVAYKLHKKMEEPNMAELYVVLIINGKKTFNQVPKKLQATVKSLLESIGLDENGDPIEA